MSKKIIPFLFCLLFGALANSQTDSLPPVKTEEKDASAYAEAIAVARIELRVAMLRQNSSAAGFWLDSLARLGNIYQTATLWDERWLIYHWLGRYEQLFSEVAVSNMLQILESGLVQPPNDSLFKQIDEIVYEQRLAMFDNIRRSDLKEEDKLFAILNLEYLLRIGYAGDARLQQDKKIESFIKKYPDSRFRPFIRNYMYDGAKPGSFALGLDVAFAYGNWTDELERSLTPYFGLHAGLGYWKKGWNLQARGAFGRQKLARPVYVNGFEWPKNDPASSVDLSMEFGRDIINQERLRIFPSAGIGVHFLHPPSPGEDEDPPPVYYDNFYFSSLSLTAALTTDLKFLYKGEYSQKNNSKDSYHGIRIRAGYTKLNFGRKTEVLGGNLIFFAVGYNLFGMQSARRTL